MGEATFPLAGLRVLEASEGIAGAYAAKLLADQGAEVVKLERPGDGDPLRRWAASQPDERPPSTGALFEFLNAGKSSVTAGDVGLDRPAPLMGRGDHSRTGRG